MEHSQTISEDECLFQSSLHSVEKQTLKVSNIIVLVVSGMWGGRKY